MSISRRWWLVCALSSAASACSSSGSFSIDRAIERSERGEDAGEQEDEGEDGEDRDEGAGDPDGEDDGDAGVDDDGSATATPTIALIGPAELALDCDQPFQDPGAEADDGAGNALEVSVEGADALPAAAPGTYTLRYSAESEGRTVEVTRTVRVCGPACGDLGKEPLQLRDWTVIQYEQNSQGDANWSLAPDGLSVTQTINADASILLSSFDAADFAIEGRWRMNNAGDDDFVGFVFGYQDRGHYYLFDWKRGTQSYSGALAQQGMSLKIVHAAAPDAGGEIQLSTADLWHSVGTANVSPLLRDGMPVRNDVRWEFGVDYFFFLEFHPGSFRIEVRDGTNALLESWSIHDGTYLGGAFGFYNHSQGPVVYQSFTRRETPPACSTVQ